MTSPIDPTEKHTSTDREKMPVDATAVKAFLKAHPGFITENPDLLESLAVPVSSTGDNVVDLQRVMVERLQHKVRALRDIQAELIDAASINALTRDRVHKAVLQLLEAKNFEELIAYITEPAKLAAALDLDTVALAIESRADAPGLGVRGLRILEAGGTDRAIGPDRAHRLAGDIEANPRLYGQSAPHVRSEALVRLTFSKTTPPGLLALGSAQPDQFHEAQAADLLEFLGRVVERAVRIWLDLPRIA